ncbi:hypothetical protein niasHT_003548 [Heterodera trifolii]|uniref:Ubiquitin-like protease family profile domain-containing protein n=1 Tax=Heterodera trifolii TaxID=157864 RepID=A0ABD2LTI2_9BILA
MPSKQQNLRKKKKEGRRQTEQSVSPGRSPVPDGSADENGVASHPGTNTPNIGALQLSTPASSTGSKRRSIPPKAGNEAITASQNSVSSVGTQIALATQNIEASPRSKRGKVDDVDRANSVIEAFASTPVSTQRNRGRPAKKTRGPGRVKTNDSMSESSSMDQSSEAITNVVVLPNMPEKLNFSTVQINFATSRNMACKIRRWADVGLYERDGETAQGPRSGPRFIETCWNRPNEWLNSGFTLAYLAYIASISQRKTVVVDSMASRTDVPRFRTLENCVFGYDPNVVPEVVLLPLHFPNHWTLIVYDVAHGAYFVDSLHMSSLSDERTALIQSIITELVPGSPPIAVEYVQQLTKQNDGNSCGYFVCLYAESWLMNNRTFVLPDLSINYEKKRILWHINELYGSDNVPYHAREGVPTPCPIVYRHADEVQSTSKAVEPMETSGQAVNAILTQAQVDGENQADSLGVVSDSCIQQEPIAQVDDEIFLRPKTPPRRSLRVQKRLSASASRSPSLAQTVRPRTNMLGPATPLTKRCLMVHNGWHCAAAAAKHFPEYSHSGNLGDHKCPHCGALLFLHEDSSLCCRKGRVVLPKLNPHPQELMDLIVGENQPKQGKEFVRRMSRYNNLLQFASVSAGNKPSPAGGPMAVILNGEFHRRISIF